MFILSVVKKCDIMSSLNALALVEAVSIVAEKILSFLFVLLEIVRPRTSNGIGVAKRRNSSASIWSAWQIWKGSGLIHPTICVLLVVSLVLLT